MTPKYILDISLKGEECTRFLGVYGSPLEWHYLTTRGQDLEELVQNATLSTLNEEGKCGPMALLIDLPVDHAARLTRLIRDEMARQDDKRRIHEP